MFCIKKVSATPLPKNEGKIIDSFNTQDDKRKNAPSLHAVQEKLDDKVDGQFLVRNYYSKTDIDEVLTSEKFHFTSTDGEIDIVFKRVGKIVFVYYYPVIYGNEPSATLFNTIELPDWAKISETPTGNINICSKLTCGGWSYSESDGISLGSISRFSITKQANGLYRFRYSYVDTNPPYTDPPENRNLIAENTSYLVY